MAPLDVNIDWVGETKDSKYFGILYGGATTRGCWTPIYLHDWTPQYWTIWNSNFGEENGENIWINNINIGAIDVYFRSSRSLWAHHVVPSAFSSAKCTLHGRRPFSPACCRLSRAGEACFLPILARGDGCRHFLPSAKSLTTVYAPTAKPVHDGVLPPPTSRRTRLFADIDQENECRHVMSSAVLFAGINAPPAKPVLTGWQSRLSAYIGRETMHVNNIRCTFPPN